jgi:hypothetical protein
MNVIMVITPTVLMCVKDVIRLVHFVLAVTHYLSANSVHLTIFIRFIITPV